VSAYIYNTGANHKILSSTPLTIEIVGSTNSVKVTSPILSCTIALTPDANWAHIIVTVAAGTVTVYQENVSKGTGAIDAGTAVTTTDLVTIGNTATLYDLRIYAGLAWSSATWAYYLVDVANGGDVICPQQ
jgi:hypothetical protein